MAALVPNRRRRMAPALVGVVAFCVVAAQGQSTSATHRGAAHTVVIRQMQFNPAQLTVNAGDTIEWKNEDIYAHTATAYDGSFDSGLIAPGASWKTTVTKSGEIAYHCRPHPNMKATIVAAGGTTSGERSESLRWEPPHKPNEIHPILVNFTAALLPLAFLSDLLGRLLRRSSLNDAAWWMVLYEAAITPLTVAAGWWWKSTMGSTLPPRVITVHQWLGTAAALLFIGLAVWRWKIRERGVPPSNAYLAVCFAVVLALVFQGSLGGMMVFGR